MERRKKVEAHHYDQLAKKWAIRKVREQDNTDVEALNHKVFSSYQFCAKWLKKNVKREYNVLDYGCGNGIHSILPASLGATVTGIDISEESLKIARQLAKQKGVQNFTIFLKMDCEKLSFPNGSFDIIFDGGTFSSLDLIRALPELARVLKPDGTLIAIETLGHNPLTNFKRKMNKLRGMRTSWAVEHILKMEHISLIKQHFAHVETHFFHLLSLFVFPFLSLPGGSTLLHTLEKIDSLALKIPFLKKYAFKIVIVASKPKKLMKLNTSAASVLRGQIS